MKCRSLVLLLLSFMLSLPAWAVRFSVYHLTCEQNPQPLALETTQPRFSWEINADERGFVQSARQIIVSDDPQALAKGEGNIWDSGKMNGPDQILVPFGGKTLQSGKRYYYKVRVWNDKGEASAWSQPATFSMGLLTNADWSGAKWIAFEKDQKDMQITMGIHAFSTDEIKKALGDKSPGSYRMPQFRKEFKVGKKVSRAMAYVSGLGQFELFLNGEKVSDHFLDPAWTKYDKCVMYVAFDITKQLREGANAVGVMLGNGFFNMPRERYLKLVSSYGAPRMLMKIHLEYTDGTSADVISGKDWKVTASPVSFSSIYGGEDFDATKLQKGWMLPGFDDKSWNSVLVSDWKAQLMAQQSEPVTVRERIPSVRVFKSKTGKYVYDLGQNFSGIVSLKVSAARSQSIKMYPAELLNPDSTVNQSASGEPYWFGYTTSGNGEESWHPQFSYYGFRYVQIEGAVPAGQPNPDALPVIDELSGLHTTLSAENVGTFHCSDNFYNSVFSLIDWAIRSNMSNVLTDCPHREKLGWLEQAHLMQPSMQYNYNLARMFPKVFNDMRSTQFDNGLIPDIAPEYVRFEVGFLDSPEWGSASILSPWNIYKWYGDSRPLADNYVSMQRYLDYLTSTAKNHIVSHGLGDWYDIGPKSPGNSQLTSYGVTSTAIYYMDALTMQKTAALLGKTDDAAHYAQLATDIYKAFNDTYWNKDTKKYDRDSQTANSMALVAGLVPEENRATVAANLLADIKNHNYALTAGDIGFTYLVQALEQIGASDVIVKMNSRYDVPGYGWQLAHGATACTESWQAYGFVSNNHMMLGHLMEWLYAGLGGLRVKDDAVAFREFVIRPEIVGEVKSAAVTYHSSYGMIRSEWKLSGESFLLDLEVPVGSSALVYLPASDAASIMESGLSVSEEKELTVVGSSEGRVIVKVPSGSYHFQMAKASL